MTIESLTKVPMNLQIAVNKQPKQKKSKAAASPGFNISLVKSDPSVKISSINDDRINS